MAKACDTKYINFKDVHIPRTESPEAIKAARAKTEAAGFDDHGRRHDQHEEPTRRRSARTSSTRRPRGIPLIVAAPEPRSRSTSSSGCAKEFQHQDRDSQPRPRGQDLPVAVRRLQGDQGARQDDGPVRGHRPHVARRRRIRPRRCVELRDRVYDLHVKDLSRPEGQGQPGDRRQGRDRFPRRCSAR